MAAILKYGNGLRQPLVRAAKDNQSFLGRSWQVAWIVGLVVAGLCITGAIKDLGTTDYIKKLFDECKVFEASCYVSLGLFVGYILFGKSQKAAGYVATNEILRTSTRTAYADNDARPIAAHDDD